MRLAALVALALAGCVSSQSAEIRRLDARLLAAPSATAVLAGWCSEHRFADPPRIRAEVDRDAARPATLEQRARLRVGADEPLRYRRVRLLCGTRLMSEAENWYVPARLRPEMNAALEGGDTPFGTAIAPLHPTRRNLQSEVLKASRRKSGNVLRHRALVLDATGLPLAEVVETYKASAIE